MHVMPLQAPVYQNARIVDEYTNTHDMDADLHPTTYIVLLSWRLTACHTDDAHIRADGAAVGGAPAAGSATGAGAGAGAGADAAQTYLSNVYLGTDLGLRMFKHR